MSTSAVHVMLALGALGAALALLSARLGAPAASHVLAVAGALCGAAAFVTVAVSTIRDARRLPSRRGRP